MTRGSLVRSNYVVSGLPDDLTGLWFAKAVMVMIAVDVRVMNSVRLALPHRRSMSALPLLVLCDFTSSFHCCRCVVPPFLALYHRGSTWNDG